VKSLRPGSIHDPAIETEAPEHRRSRLDAALVDAVRIAWRSAPRARRMLEAAGLHPGHVRGQDDLPRIPITRKDALVGLQADEPPFAGLAAVDPGTMARIYASPGPILDPQGTDGDCWRLRHAMAAAGFRAGDVVLNSASYHLTPGGFMVDGGARALGCAVIPGGTGQTELQLRVASALGASAYTGMPSFLFHLLQRARETGIPLGFDVAFVFGEMLPESLRADIQSFGVRCLQGYPTADLGCLAYECTGLGGWHLHPGVIVEVLDLETGRAAEPGQPGEIVATSLDPAYPLLRFATGDVGALTPPSRCPCGRTAPKLAGILGRVGDAVKVKGMFVRGAQVEAVLRGFPEAGKFRATVTREGHVDLLGYDVEVEDPRVAGLVERIATALQEAVKVRGTVRLVATGALGDLGKRIDDRRRWE
jgi:phenylacetate-CoA ligase